MNNLRTRSTSYGQGKRTETNALRGETLKIVVEQVNSASINPEEKERLVLVVYEIHGELRAHYTIWKGKTSSTRGAIQF